MAQQRPNIREHATWLRYAGDTQETVEPRLHLVPTASRPDRRPPTVLVADDERQIVDFLASLLEDEGFQVLRAYDGPEALRLAQDFAPVLVISDVMMPGLSGTDLARRLAENGCKDAPRVVLMSAVTSVPEVDGVHFLSKPFDISDILDIVASVPAAAAIGSTSVPC